MMRRSRRPRWRNGFTLIEMLVVLVLLGLLAGLIGPQLFGRVSDARITTARTQIELIGVALDSYRLDNGAYPTTAQGLDALVIRPARQPAAPNWRGPYLRKALPADPWSRPYLYASPSQGGEGYALRSLGRDGKEGGSGEDADLGSGALQGSRQR
jgi:general secretion pathway protein G